MWDMFSWEACDYTRAGGTIPNPGSSWGASVPQEENFKDCGLPCALPGCFHFYFWKNLKLGKYAFTCSSASLMFPHLHRIICSQSACSWQLKIISWNYTAAKNMTKVILKTWWVRAGGNNNNNNNNNNMTKVILETWWVGAGGKICCFGEAPPPSMKCATISIGMGKMIVLLFSAAMLFKVWR